MERAEYLKKLENPYYLPFNRSEILSGVGKYCSIDLIDVLGYEIITEHLIQGLTRHLHSYSTSESLVKVLEVGAGHGKLAHFLKKNLSKRYENLFDVRAVDNNDQGDQSWENQLPIVENMDMHEAVATYKPNIIIASWLKMHPRNLLSSDLLSRLNELSQKDPKSPDEKTEFVKLANIYEEAEKGDDITSYRRKNPELQEYILIGPVPMVGFESAIEKIYGCCRNDDVLHPVPNPDFAKDGFEREYLPIDTINTREILGYSDNSNIDIDYFSQVYSFKRAK